MKTVGWLAPVLAGIVLTCPQGLPAGVQTEDFDSSPWQRGWRVFGDAAFFDWDASAGALRVTWDSRQTNSYCYRPLDTILTREDDFSLAFELRLDDFTPGIDPARNNSPFQIAVALINVANATAPGFLRGSGFQSPNLCEFAFFPDPGGQWQWGPSLTVVLCDRTGLNWSSGGFLPAGLATNDLFRIRMSYSAASRTLSATLQRNGEPPVEFPPAVLGTNFTDLRLDAVAVCSYWDEGQWPGFEGSILAHGILDNLQVTTPSPPVEQVSGGLVNGAWQVRLAGRSGWIYALERTTDFKSWLPVPPEILGDGGLLTLQDTNPPPAGAFYRVVARLP